MEKNLWKIKINFHNKTHDIMAIVDMDGYYYGTETIEQIVYPSLMKKLAELKWGGFGLWAQHEPIYKQTILDEISYQRSADGSIRLDCEDHNCRWRSITVPLIRNPECVICCVVLDDKNASYPTCFHSSTCKDCYKTLDKCPICRKPFKSTHTNTLM